MQKHKGAYLLLVFLILLTVAAMVWVSMDEAARAETMEPAEGVTVDLPQEPVGQGPYDWTQIATIPGAIAATLLIVQYLKLPLDKAWRIPTRYWVLLIAFGLLALAQSMIRGLTWPDVPLVALNAFVVALAAMGAYEVSFAKLGK